MMSYKIYVLYQYNYYYHNQENYNSGTCNMCKGD
jgi:hypothetical protein